MTILSMPLKIQWFYHFIYVTSTPVNINLRDKFLSV